MKTTTIHEKGVGAIVILPSGDPEFPIAVRLLETGTSARFTRREARRTAQALLSALKELGPAK